MGHARFAAVSLALGLARPAVAAEIGWSSYLGGVNADHGRGVALDAAGNVFVTGYTFSTDFPAGGGFDTALGGASDAFVAKIDPTGASLLWSSLLGGSDDEHGHAVAVDAAGDAYVTGYTVSTDFPAAGGFDSTPAGVDDAFVAKIGGGGALLWAAYLGGSGPDQGDGIAIDSAGAAIVVGHTLSPNFPASGGFDVTLDGGDDGFVTRVLSVGALDWSTYLGGDSDDWASAVATDAAGQAYVTGYTISADFPIVGGFDTGGGGGVEDAFVARIDAAGPTLVWSSFLGGSAADRGLGVAVDAAGAVYVCGQTVSSSFPAAGGFDSTLGGTLDAFVAKVDATGSSLVWSSFLGGAGADYGYAIGLDAAGVPHVAGRTLSADFPAAGGFDTALAGSSDGFVARIDPAGTAIAWSSYVGGGGGNEYATAVAVAPEGNLVLAGETFSDDFPATGGFSTARSGGSDAFATRIVACGSGTCEPGENACNCPNDCGADSCPNGCCGPAETTCDCPADCAVEVCGDACCGTAETACTCETDCGADTCGNGCCGAAETECTCADDCAEFCGDTCCGPLETACSCEADCGGDACGNGCCGPAETACDCEADCGVDACGNGCCGALETPCDCPADCGPDTCNNGCCGEDETADSCPDDCPNVCGDGFCRGDEDCEGCATDCGRCDDESPDTGGGSGCGCTFGRTPDAGATLALGGLALVGFSARRRLWGRAPGRACRSPGRAGATSRTC
jgi:hypothetical protein